MWGSLAQRQVRRRVMKKAVAHLTLRTWRRRRTRLPRAGQEVRAQGKIVLATVEGKVQHDR